MTPALLRYVEQLHDDGTHAVAVLDKGMRIRMWNDAMRELSGLTSDAVAGVRVHDLFPRLWGTAAERALGAALRGDASRVDDPFFAAANPVAARDAEWFVSPLLADGHIRGCVVVARSRKKRELGERERIELEERFTAMANGSPVLLWMSGADSLCTFFNQTWLAFSGRSMEQELGVGWTEGIHPEDFQVCMNTYMRAFSAREAFEMEYRLRRHDGEYRWLLDRGAPRFAVDGTFVGFIGSCVDITARRIAEQATAAMARDLERANAQMEQLLYAASHDLHEPIRMVTNFLELLHHHAGDKLDATETKYLDFAREGGVRMGTLVEGLLAISRTRSITPKLEPVDARHVVDLVLRDLSSVVHENQATLDLGALPVVKADAALLRSLFQNLLSNAIKFRSELAPQIRVAAERRAEEWIFSVQDNGMGFSSQDATRVFEMFRRLHPRAERPGNGIGLALAREIVRRHGGEIWARSEPGCGATFMFSLPDAPR